MTRLACALALLVLLAVACGDGSEEPTGPLTGLYVGQEIWISYGPEEEGEGARRTGRTREDAHDLARGLRARVRKGEDIGDLAREHSNAPGGAAAGFSGILPRDPQHPDARDRALASVRPGRLTKLVEWHRGFWFARRVSLERGEELRLLFERLGRLRVSFRTIVLLYQGAWIPDKMFRPRYSLEQATILAGELLARAKSGESFAGLAREYSEDASGERGGLVTLLRPDGSRTKWLHVAETGVAAKVLKAAFATPPGKIHPEVIVSPRGVYVLKVEERKEIEPEDQ